MPGAASGIPAGRVHGENRIGQLLRAAPFGGFGPGGGGSGRKEGARGSCSGRRGSGGGVLFSGAAMSTRVSVRLVCPDPAGRRGGSRGKQAGPLLRAAPTKRGSNRKKRFAVRFRTGEAGRPRWVECFWVFFYSTMVRRTIRLLNNIFKKHHFVCLCLAIFPTFAK